MSPEPKSAADVAQKSDNELALRASLLSEYVRVFSKLFKRYGITAVTDELRDAGRQSDYSRERTDDDNKAREHLEQADENLSKALADTVANIKEEIRRHDDSLRYANLNEHFGHYQELSGVLSRINRQVKNARESREQRDEVYRNLAESAELKDLLTYFDELRSSVPAIRASVARKNRALLISVFSLATGLITLVAILSDLLGS